MSRDPRISNDQTLHIEQIVRESNSMIGAMLNRDKRILAIGIEINQRYFEYLEELENALTDGRIQIGNSVTVIVDGKKIKFKNTDDFSNWLSENLT